MRTLTEFNAIQLKNAAQAKKDLLASGKTAEELPQALGETLKIEGDKLTFILSALELLEEKPQEYKDVKRVIVAVPAEGETAPSGAKQKGEHYYTIQAFAAPISAKPQSKPEGRGDKRGKRGGRRDGGGDRKPGRGPRAPRNSGNPAEAGAPKAE
jgi:hypothetical protein